MKEHEIKGQSQSDHSGKELRDRSWELINAAGLDYTPKHISEYFNGRAAPIDGLIRTSHGYYRLAEDMRDGTRVLLHSYERGQLTGIEKDGKVVLADDANDIYGVAARQSLRGSLFRYLMERDIWELSKIFQQDLNLHAEEMTVSSETPGISDRRKIKLANGKLAFSIIETDEGKWRIRYFKNLRDSWDDTGSFAFTASEKNSLRAKIFNPMRMIAGPDGTPREFEMLDDALTFVRQYWKNESARLFQGKEPNDPTINTPRDKIRDGALSWILRLEDQKILRDWTRALSIGVGVGIVSSVATGAPVIGALFAAGSIFGWTFAGKAMETATALLQEWLLKNADKQKVESRLLAEERDVTHRYIRAKEQNGRRYRRKISHDAKNNLRLLSVREADILHDDAEPMTPENRLRDFERLSTAAFRYFGAQFDSSNENAKDGVLVALYPNGLVSLMHVEKQTRAARHYVTYNKAFDVFGKDEAYKHLDPKLTELPAEGAVHKITHRQGRDFRYTPMNGDEFMADLSAKLGRDAYKIRAFGMPVSKLFNCTACSGLHPAPKEGIPVEYWLERDEMALPFQKEDTMMPGPMPA